MQLASIDLLVAAITQFVLDWPLSSKGTDGAHNINLLYKALLFRDESKFSF